MALKNYKLGRGEVHFSKLDTVTKTFGPFRYLGNTPEFNINIESDSLDHFSSDHGVGEKDASVPTTMSRTASIVADEIVAENIAMYLFGSVTQVSVSAMASAQVDTITAVKLGYGYPLGVDANDKVGALKVIFPGAGATQFKVTDSTGTTTYTAGTDYIFDQKTMLVTPLKGGTIVAGSTIKINWAEAAYTTEQIQSGSDPVEGRIRYVEDNPMGDDTIWNLPYVVVRPNGDFALKAESDWQALPFDIEILKDGSFPAIIVNGLAL